MVYVTSTMVYEPRDILSVAHARVTPIRWGTRCEAEGVMQYATRKSQTTRRQTGVTSSGKLRSLFWWNKYGFFRIRRNLCLCLFLFFFQRTNRDGKTPNISPFIQKIYFYSLVGVISSVLSFLFYAVELRAECSSITKRVKVAGIPDLERS